MMHTSLYGRPTTAGAMTMIMTPAQYEIWNKGHWDAYAIEQDYLEQCNALGICEPVAVLSPDGKTVAFGVTQSRPQQGRAS